MSDFSDFLGRAATLYETKQEFARAIGITPGRFSRLLRGEFSMEVVNCLRLAKISGESPSRVLRLAGKSEIADLIEELYGRPSLAQAQRDLLEQWERLSTLGREHLRGVLREMQPASEKKTRRKSA